MKEINFRLNEITEQLRRDGIAGPLSLADTSRLDEVYDEVAKLKAERRTQLQKLRETGESFVEVVNPLIDRHMDINAIKSLFFDANLHVAAKELIGTDLFV